MNVLVKCFYPDCYDGADHAVIGVDEDLILMLDKRMAQARSMSEQGFYGTKWWDCTPTFIPCGGPDTVGVDMDEEDFEHTLDSNLFVRLADDFPLQPENYAPMGVVTLTITISRDGDQNPVASFYWTGTDKYVGNAGRVETYEMDQDTLDEWAEAVGCTEMLAKVRRGRGVEA